MATNFGPEATNVSAVQNFVTPKEGVAKDNTFLKGAADIFSNTVEAVRESKGSGVLAAFTKQQVSIIEGLETGDIRSSRMANSRLRKNLVDAIDAAGGNSDLVKEILSAHAKIRGFSNDLKDGTDAERRRRDQEDAVFEAGLADENTTQAELDIIVQQENARKVAIRQLGDRTKAIELELKQGNLNKQQQEAKQAELKEVWRNFTRENAPRELAIMRHNLGLILADPELNGADKQLAIEEAFTTFEAQNVELKQVLGTEAEDYMVVFNSLKDTYLKAASGELSLQELERQNKMEVERAKALILSDPNISFTSGVRSLFGDNALLEFYSTTPEVHKSLVNMMKKNGSLDTLENPLGTGSTNRKVNQTYLDMMLKAMSSDDPTVVNEASNQLNSWLKSIELHQGSLSVDAESGINFVRTLSSESFLKAVKKDPSILDDTSKAREALDKHFYDEVYAMVEREFTKANVLNLGTEPGTVRVNLFGDREAGPEDEMGFQAAPDAVTFKFNENIIEFIPIDPSNKVARDKAIELNTDLAPVIRNLVKADAHLQGSNNYKARMEAIAPFFVGEPRTQAGGGDEGDELNLEDFTFPTVSAGGLPEEVANDAAFLDEVERVADKHGFEPETLLAIMDFETGGTFNPSEPNKAGSSGTGLIQFMADTAKGLGTTTRELARMNRTEQMQWVDKYLSQWDLKGKSTSDVYMAVLFPKAINKSGSYVLFRKGTKAYAQNKGLDKNGDGTVTKDEAARKVVSLVGKHS